MLYKASLSLDSALKAYYNDSQQGDAAEVDMKALLPHCISCLPVVSSLLGCAADVFVETLHKWTFAEVVNVVPKCTSDQYMTLIGDSVTKYVSNCLLNKYESDQIVAVVEAASKLQLEKNFASTLQNLKVVLQPAMSLPNEVECAYRRVESLKDSDKLCMAFWYWPSGKAMLKGANDVLEARVADCGMKNDVKKLRQACNDDVAKLHGIFSQEADAVDNPLVAHVTAMKNVPRTLSGFVGKASDGLKEAIREDVEYILAKLG